MLSSLVLVLNLFIPILNGEKKYNNDEKSFCTRSTTTDVALITEERKTPTPQTLEVNN
jgi:hypothetical protein